MRSNWSKSTKEYIQNIEDKMREMGVLETVDKDNFNLLGDAIEIYNRARKEVDEKGITVQEGPYTRQNPALQIMRQQQAIILSFLKEFSVTCRGRRLLVKDEFGKEEETPLATFLDMVND